MEMYIFDDTTTLSFTDDTLKAKIAVFLKISHHLWTVFDGYHHSKNLT